MQLTLDIEDSNIDVKENMSALESLSEKPISNGVIPEANIDVPNENKENISTQDVLCNKKGNVSIDQEKQADQITVTTLTEENREKETTQQNTAKEESMAVRTDINSETDASHKNITNNTDNNINTESAESPHDSEISSNKELESANQIINNTCVEINNELSGKQSNEDQVQCLGTNIKDNSDLNDKRNNREININRCAESKEVDIVEKTLEQKASLKVNDEYSKSDLKDHDPNLLKHVKTEVYLNTKCIDSCDVNDNSKNKDQNIGDEGPGTRTKEELVPETQSKELKTVADPITNENMEIEDHEKECNKVTESAEMKNTQVGNIEVDKQPHISDLVSSVHENIEVDEDLKPRDEATKICTDLNKEGESILKECDKKPTIATIPTDSMSDQGTNKIMEVVTAINERMEVDSKACDDFTEKSTDLNTDIETNVDEGDKKTTTSATLTVSKVADEPIDCDDETEAETKNPIDCDEIVDTSSKKETDIILPASTEDKINVAEATDNRSDDLTNASNGEIDAVTQEINSSDSAEVISQNAIDKQTAVMVGDVTIVTAIHTVTTAKDKDEILDVDKEGIKTDEVSNESVNSEKDTPKVKVSATICRLSNTLDILSDDEDEPPTTVEPTTNAKSNSTEEKQYINVDDDDDIMLIDEDTNFDSSKVKETSESDKVDDTNNSENDTIKLDHSNEIEIPRAPATIPAKEVTPENEIVQEIYQDKNIEMMEKPKPLIPDNFFKSYKKNVADMTRDDLEEFCILKIVESIIDRSNLNEIKSKLKTMTLKIGEYKKKAEILTKQNRDLELVIKSVQEEQKKNDAPIAPLKITRSVGMQVLMTEKSNRRKGIIGPPPTVPNSNNKMVRNNMNQNPRPQRPNISNTPIPVPRLVPASNSAVMKSSNSTPQVNATNNTVKNASPATNGVRTTPPTQKAAEKRTLGRIQSVTVDLTDDEPPCKVSSRSPAAVPPVRLVPPQNLLQASRQQQPFTPSTNSPRKVYIPISGPQGSNVRTGQTIMLKSVPSASGPRQRSPITPVVRVPQNPVRMTRLPNNRHPAPLPDAMKQYQPPNWKALPPAPDLKLAKVENGIVISWKIDGYQEDSYEEIASYQLFAYQETPSPPSTNLWKKIGDVKALPLPMACTLTQFMAGYKYFFAVRAVDIRSRLGPFSLPGSILLINKM